MDKWNIAVAALSLWQYYSSHGSFSLRIGNIGNNKEEAREIKKNNLKNMLTNLAEEDRNEQAI